MKDRTKIGFDEYDSLVQERSVPAGVCTTKVKMGESGTLNYPPNESAGMFSVWTDSVGPCHAVLIHGTSKSNGWGTLGIVHVSGKASVIVKEAETLLEEMEKTMACEVFIVGGDKEGAESGHTFDESNISSKLQGKVKLVISPVSQTGSYIKVELTGARKINVEPDT